MLSFFRRNLFINYVLLFVFTLALHIYYFIRPISTEINWSFEEVSKVFDFLSTNELTVLCSSVALISIQAIILNSLVTKNKFSRVLSTIPGAVFVLLACIAIEPHFDLRILIANLFFLFSIASLFNLYKKYLPIATIFNSGFFTACAAILYQPYIIFCFILLIGLYSLRALNIKEFIQFLCGFALPFFFLLVYNYSIGSHSEIYNNFFKNLELPNFSELFYNLHWLKLSLFGLAICIAVMYYNDIKKKKKFDAIKKIELCYWLILTSLPSIFLIESIGYGHLIVLSIPLSLILGLILETKHQAIAKEFFFLLAVLAYFGFQLELF